MTGRVVGIAEDTLDFILELARDNHPEGYTAYLQGRRTQELGVEGDGVVVTEVVFQPEMNRGNVFSVLGIDTLPRGSVVGSVRSKAGETPRLDEDDYERFSDLGSRHIIVLEPYTHDSWTCYDPKGEEAGLGVYDVDFEGEEYDVNVD